MSLTTEKLALQSKVTALGKERAILAIKADMQILNVRAEASPLLDLDQINTNRLTVAVEELCDYVRRTGEIDMEIRRLEKLM